MYSIPNTGEIRSDSADGIACWFVDTDYNEESFFVRHAYFLGASDPYKALRTTLRCRDQPGSLGDPTQRHFSTLRETDFWQDCRESYQSLRGRGDEGVSGVTRRIQRII